MLSPKCVNRSIISIALLCSLSSANLIAQEAPAASKKIDWLRGEKESLEIRLQGESFSAEGQPAEGATVIAKMVNYGRTPIEIPVTLQGHRFEAWVPVGKVDSFTIFLEGVSRDGKESRGLRLSRSELRRFAMNGLKLSLRPFDRTVEIKVLDQGTPVIDAKVRIASVLQAEFVASTNKEGVIRFNTFEENELLAITAWTEDHRIGGYQFARMPKRNPKLDQHTIDLSACRPQKIRVVNQADDKPIAGVAFTLYVATPKAANFIGVIPPSRMTTDEKGEATFEWFPDWPKHVFYAEEIDKEWTKTGEDYLDADGVIQVHVEKSKLPPRKQISARVTTADGPVAGCCVEFRSPRLSSEERRQEDLCAFTDEEGRFTLNFVPGAVYWGYILDEQLVSQINEFLPFDPREEKEAPPDLVAFEGNPVEVFVGDGADKKPMANVIVALFHTYEYTWSNGEATKRSIDQIQWWARTDEKGIAKSVSLPARSLRVRVMQPDWDSEKTVRTIGGAATKIEFIRGAPKVRQLPVDDGLKLLR